MRTASSPIFVACAHPLRLLVWLFLKCLMCLCHIFFQTIFLEAMRPLWGRHQFIRAGDACSRAGISCWLFLLYILRYPFESWRHGSCSRWTRFLRRTLRCRYVEVNAIWFHFYPLQLKFTTAIKKIYPIFANGTTFRHYRWIIVDFYFVFLFVFAMQRYQFIITAILHGCNDDDDNNANHAKGSTKEAKTNDKSSTKWTPRSGPRHSNANG